MATFPGSISALVDPVQDSDGSHSDTITIPGSAPYTHQLGQGAGSSLNYPSGWQVVPPSNIAGIVAVSGGSHGTWTEVVSGSSLSAGQFSVDYTASPTGGTVTFSSADAGMASVVIDYTGALLVNDALVKSIFEAARAVTVGRGGVNGLAGLDASSLLTPAQARPIHQVQLSKNTTNPNLTATTWTNIPYTMSPAPSLTTVGGQIAVRLSAMGLNSGGAPVSVYFQAIINGVAYSLGSEDVANATDTFTITGENVTPALAAGTYGITLQYKISSAVNVATAVGSIVVRAEEII